MLEVERSDRAQTFLMPSAAAAAAAFVLLLRRTNRTKRFCRIKLTNHKQSTADSGGWSAASAGSFRFKDNLVCQKDLGPN